MSTDNPNPRCVLCGGTTERGTAFANTLVGHGREATDRGATLSSTGPAQLVMVWKCVKCGHSFTPSKQKARHASERPGPIFCAEPTCKNVTAFGERYCAEHRYLLLRGL